MSPVHDLEDQLLSSDDELYEEETHNPIPNRPSKRTRTSTGSSKPKPARKKYVKGKQGGLQGIMKMPIEVFMEIAHHVHPGDLISLIRTSKFFRSMLLNRSAILVWQRALGGVPELPPCPTGMVEPQYTALMFSKNCTICGALAKSKPDPYLRVRLCSSCRETQLEERLTSYPQPGVNFLPSTMNIKRSKKSINKHPAYYLRAQKEKLVRLENEFIRNNDKKGLAEWRLQQHKSWGTQCKEARKLTEYLNSATTSRLGELKDIKSERREQIHERLRALGWEDKYFYFYRDDEEKQWNSLVGAPKPLTDRVWTNMLPKLIQLLEENRPRIDEFDRQQRLFKRTFTVRDLLEQLKRERHAYQPIVDALKLERLPIQIGDFTLERDPLLLNPFPDDHVLDSWGLVTDLYQEENTIEQVEKLFDERREAICRKLMEWRTRAEEQLVEQYKSSFAESTSLVMDNEVTLTVQGSTDATKNLPNHTRFLLRADTVFMPKVTESSSQVDQGHGPIATCIHFPNMPCLINDGPLRSNSVFAHDDQDTEKKSLDCYVRHAGKESIVKALLKELDMPDVVHVELQDMGKVFVCGRCDYGKVMGWDALVDHYHLTRRDWLGNYFIRNTYRTRHPVIFNNLHDLGHDINPKPLVRIASNEGNNTLSSQNSTKQCIICHGVDLHRPFKLASQMIEHMREIHGTTEPVKDLHYVDVTRQLDQIRFTVDYDRGTWVQKWDYFHDSHGAGSAAGTTLESAS
ncbi:unnamed protein product [Rhizoctonia solani]|uniref:F-box domain-containing protein n=1 Tax=Rhizoctonia solani TaxID=456999 RepID=A0A8H3D7I1_9AGAM|nr:unnamed protein product [Rhizoctonia solani]